jgi:hypothetical protein
MIDTIEDGEKGNFVNSETQRILNRLMDIPIQMLQNECNIVAADFRDQWRSKDQSFMMLDPSLPNGGLENVSYGQGIDEISFPYLFTCPTSIHVKILTSVNSTNPNAAAVFPTYPEPSLEIYLPTLIVSGSKINWNGYVDNYESIIVHEFLHTCRDIQKDGAIRHNWVPTKALSNLGVDLTI